MIDFKKITLQNGLKVIYHQDTSTPFACLNVLYDVGAKDEDESKTGFAHLFEHLMFGGSININSYDEPLEKVGGENNAFTTNDYTNYYATAPADNIETLFWLESDRMLSLAFNKESLEVQRSVVIEEFKQRYLNQPYGDVWLKLKPLAYQTHPYKWCTIGKSLNHIEQAKLEDAKRFFNTFYTPSNAILVITGNISFEQTEHFAKKWFEPIASKPKPIRKLPVELTQLEAREQTVYADVPINAIYKAYHMCARIDNEYHATDLISDILSSGNSSRFYKKLIKDKQLFSDLNAYIMGDIDKGLFVIEGKVKDGINIEAANLAIEHEISLIQTELVTPDELEKCINKAEASITFSETDILTKATNLAISELLGDANLINKEIENYQKVSAIQIQQVANTVLQKNNCSTLYYLKK